jgi:hypothetical protein
VIATGVAFAVPGVVTSARVAVIASRLLTELSIVLSPD